MKDKNKPAVANAAPAPNAALKTPTPARHQEMAALMVNLMSGICLETIDNQVSERVLSLDDQVAKQGGKIDSLDRIVRRIDRKLDEQQSHLVGLRSAMDETGLALSRLRADEEQQRGQLREKLSGRVRAVELAIADDREQAANRLSALGEQIGGLATRQDESAESLRKLIDQCGMLQGRAESLASRNEALQAGAAELTRQLQSTNDRVLTLETRVAAIARAQQQAAARRRSTFVRRLSIGLAGLKSGLKSGRWLPVRIGLNWRTMLPIRRVTK